MPACAHCGHAIAPGTKIYRQDVCAGCGRALHSCKNCEFHDPGAHNQCRESQADPVAEKDRANRCEWFRPDSRAGAPAAPKPDPRAALDALFKKKP